MANAYKKSYSIFDYTVTISRKHRYLVVGTPEFGFYIASSVLDQERVSPKAIGECVFRVFEHINARLHQLASQGEPSPRPLKKKRLIDVLSNEEPETESTFNLEK
jgi:hypothetical protein